MVVTPPALCEIISDELLAPITNVYLPWDAQPITHESAGWYQPTPGRWSCTVSRRLRFVDERDSPSFNDYRHLKLNWAVGLEGTSVTAWAWFVDSMSKIDVALNRPERLMTPAADPKLMEVLKESLWQFVGIEIPELHAELKSLEALVLQHGWSRRREIGTGKAR